LGQFLGPEAPVASEPETLAAAYAETAKQLRAADRELYLLALCAPITRRPALFALSGFFAEVAALCRRAREPLPAEIRLQWWHDVLAGERPGEAEAAPLARALCAALGRHALPAEPLRAMLEARRFALYNDPMPDWIACETYCAETYATLLRLQGLVLGLPAAGAGLTGHLGMAYGLSRLLRDFAGDAGRGRLFLPASVFAAHGLSAQAVFEGQDSPAMRAALGEIAARAEIHAAAAHVSLIEGGRNVRIAASALVLARMALARCRTAMARNAFAVAIEPPDLVKLARMTLFQATGWGVGR